MSSKNLGAGYRLVREQSCWSFEFLSANRLTISRPSSVVRHPGGASFLLDRPAIHSRSVDTAPCPPRYDGEQSQRAPSRASSHTSATVDRSLDPLTMPRQGSWQKTIIRQESPAKKVIVT